MASDQKEGILIEPGAYVGKKEGKLVILFVYGSSPFLRVDMVEVSGRKDVMMHSLVNNIDPVKWEIEFISKIEMPL